MRRGFIVLSIVLVVFCLAWVSLIQTKPTQDPVTNGTIRGNETPQAHNNSAGQTVLAITKPPEKRQAQSNAKADATSAPTAMNRGDTPTETAGHAFEEFKRLHSENAPGREIAVAVRRLASALQSAPDGKATMAKLKEVAENDGTSRDARSGLIEVLGRSATVESLSILFSMTKDERFTNVKQQIVRELERAADIRWEARFHAELSPLYEQAWGTFGADETMSRAVANGMAKIGAPSGVELLLSEVMKRGQTISDFEKQNDAQAWAAFDSLQLIRNPAAIAVLSRGLRDQAGGNLELSASGWALANMGLPEATDVILAWSVHSSESTAILIKDWLSRIRDLRSEEILAQKVNDPLFLPTDSQRRAVVEAVLRTLQTSRQSP